MTTDEYLDEGTTPYEPNEDVLKYFKNIRFPTMSELVNWFQIEFTDLANAMKASDHAAKDDEPNPYHFEDSVWTHTMMVCQRAEYDTLVVKLSALLHDCGKPLAEETVAFGVKKPDYNGEARIPRDDDEEKIKRFHDRENKKMFRGHEGISFWLAIDPLERLQKMDIITESQMDEILKIISLHGMLFNRIKDGKEYKPEQVVKMFDDVVEYNNFIAQVKNDSLGRFHMNEHERMDIGRFLGDTIYNEDIFYKYVNFPPEIYPDRPTVNVMVGLPASGKSHWIEENMKEGDVLISKDIVIEEMGKEKGYGSYTDTYKMLTDDEHKEAYAETKRRFADAVRAKLNIYIDLTNMSKKSRNKWIHQLKNYNTKAVVFVTGQGQLAWRNIERDRDQGKHIPAHVYKNMMKTFIVPTLYEFDEVVYVHAK